MFYKVHYPDNIVKTHKLMWHNLCLPGLNKVFYSGDNHYYIVVEMNDEEAWVELISEDHYYKVARSSWVDKTFVHFVYDKTKLVEF